jgi:DNA-binding transcriptional ArsR family regulator
MADQDCIPLLKALADDTRWRIVRELLAGPRTVGALVERLNVSQYNVSKHVRILREAGIVECVRIGKHVECHVADGFRRRLRQNQNVLDLGCCVFHFDPSVPEEHRVRSKGGHAGQHGRAGVKPRISLSKNS